jgi:DNA-binding response OmpR family regulator
MAQRSILVVDDEAPMRKLLSVNFQACGYEVCAACDGSEALELIQDHSFHLLLLDINMPGMSGLEVLEEVRRSSRTPVLVISGRGRESDKRTALNLGADDYLAKPFRIDELLARAEALLNR